MDRRTFSATRRKYIPVGFAATSLRQRVAKNAPLSVAVLFYGLNPIAVPPNSLSQERVSQKSM